MVQQTEVPKTSPSEDTNFIRIVERLDLCCKLHGDTCRLTDECRTLLDGVADASSRKNLTTTQQFKYYSRILSLIENPPLL